MKRVTKSNTKGGKDRVTAVCSLCRDEIVAAINALKDRYLYGAHDSERERLIQVALAAVKAAR